MKDDTIDTVEKDATVVINNTGGTSIKLNNINPIPSVKKKNLSVTNAVDSSICVLFSSDFVRFLQNVE